MRWNWFAGIQLPLSRIFLCSTWRVGDFALIEHTRLLLAHNSSTWLRTKVKIRIAGRDWGGDQRGAGEEIGLHRWMKNGFGVLCCNDLGNYRVTCTVRLLKSFINKKKSTIISTATDGNQPSLPPSHVSPPPPTGPCFHVLIVCFLVRPRDEFWGPQLMIIHVLIFFPCESA